MELRDGLEKILKTKYGIENEKDLIKALEEQPGIDLGIFVNEQRGDEKSA